MFKSIKNFFQLNNFYGTKASIAKNTLYQIVGKVLSMSVTIVATFIIARVYGVEGYGEFSLMQVWPAIFFVIVDFGMNAIAAKDLTKDWSQAGKYFYNILVIRLLFSFVLVTCLLIVLSFNSLFPTYSANLIFGIKLSLLLIFTQAMFATGNILFQTKMRYDLSTIALVGGYVYILFWILGGAYLGASIAWVNFGYVIGGFVTFLLVLHFVKSFGISWEPKLDFKLWKYLFIQTLPLGIMFIFSQINFKVDSFLLSVLKLPAMHLMSNTEAAGIYNLPYKIFEVALVIPTFIMNSLYPVMVQRKSQSKSEFIKLFKKSAIAMTAIGLAFSFLGILFAPLIIKILGGAQFDKSVFVLQMLLGGMFLYYMTAPLSWFLVVIDKQLYLPFIYFIASIFNFVCNVVFIPKYSFYASTVITHFSEFVILILLLGVSLASWKRYYAK